ncbi:MAG: hypothetical protein SFW67_13320 [Myxococcaceae bacterium]|nr:hypothetical protein [Myxococcaceae bacterium]
MLDLIIEQQGTTPIGPGTWRAKLEVGAPTCTATERSSRCPAGGSPFTVFDGDLNAQVTLTRLDGRTDGTFTATMSSGASLSGSFSAEPCAFFDWEQPLPVLCE